MERVEIGKIVAIHGLKGYIKVLPWTDDADIFTKVKQLELENGESYKINDMKLIKNCVALKLKGIDTPERALELKNQMLYIKRTQLPKLPEGSYYIRDLIGLRVVLENGDELGAIEEVLQTGSNDVYLVRTKEGKQLCIPVIKDVILSISLADALVVIRPLDGLL